MVKQPGLYSPMLGATSSQVFTQSPQKSQQNPEFTVWPVVTGAASCHNCCIDGCISPEYYEYHLVYGTKLIHLRSIVFLLELTGIH
jgi:hypothetical protein